MLSDEHGLPDPDRLVISPERGPVADHRAAAQIDLSHQRRVRRNVRVFRERGHAIIDALDNPVPVEWLQVGDVLGEPAAMLVQRDARLLGHQGEGVSESLESAPGQT